MYNNTIFRHINLAKNIVEEVNILLKSRVFLEHNGNKYEKMFVAGNIIKCEIKRGKLMITLSSYKGANTPSEYTNDIIVSDEKRAQKIKTLKKGTMLFCDINITKTTYNNKPIENLYLFNFEIGKEGQGEVLFNGSTPANANANANINNISRNNNNSNPASPFPGEFF